MNIENMKKLIGQLERLPDENFYMGSWIHHRDCGTVACVAGWCALLNGGADADYTEDFAQQFLGLDSYEADRLFFGKWVNFAPDDTDLHPYGARRNWTKATRQEAIDEMKRMLDMALKPGLQAISNL